MADGFARSWPWNLSSSILKPSTRSYCRNNRLKLNDTSIPALARLNDRLPEKPEGK